jgi:hypothetical protein
VEQVAIVVRSLVEALLDGARVGLASPTSISPVPERGAGGSDSGKKRPGGAAKQAAVQHPAPMAIPAVRNGRDRAIDEARAHPTGARTFALTTAYAGAQFATNAAWQSGLSLGFRWLALPPLYAGARYTFVPELEASAEGTAISIARHPAEVLVGYVGATPIAANAELGVIADYTQRRTRSNAPGYTPAPPRNRATIALGARAGVSWSATETLALNLRGGADLLLTRYSYVVPAGEPVAAPHGVRPRLELELAVGLW